MTTHRRRLIGALGAASATLTVLALVSGGAVSSAAPGPSAVAASGLHVASDQLVPHAKGTANIVAGEAPDGAVFLAVRLSASTDAIEVATGSHAPKVVTDVPGGTVAIAASHSLFFVAGRTALSGFRRSSGAVTRTWSVRVPKSFGLAGGPMVYGDGRLWAVRLTSKGREVVEINPSSATITTVGSGHNVENLAVGPRGVYFVQSGGHTLVRVAANGTHVTAPTHETVNEHLSGPAAVQPIAVSGKTLLVAHDFGQGEDAELIRYNAASLAKLSEVSTNLFHTDIVPTVDGNLLLFNGTVGGCSTPAHPVCVAEISTTTAKTSHGRQLPAGQALSALVGPHPAVVVRHAGHVRLVRLS